MPISSDIQKKKNSPGYTELLKLCILPNCFSND